MRKNIVLAFFASVLSVSAIAQDLKTFGKSFELQKPVAAKELGKMKKSQLSDVQVEAEVVSVCQAAGCWMKVKLENGETMRVTFKDYGFFVPKDLAGSKIYFKGKAEITETSVSDLKHYAADAGKSKSEIDAITEPTKEMAFVADGVLVPSR
ncbi:MAG: DUF4920 domain-containing protein [Cytophagales bacterium]|nr:DUF4920 domain-containing protein [Cytophagales bacterium]